MLIYLREIINISKGSRYFILSESLLGIAIGIYSLVFNLHLLEIGLTEVEIGEILSIGALVMGIFSIPAALSANRYGRKKLLILGIGLLAVGYAGIGIGVDYFTFFVSQIIASIGITLLITSEIQLLYSYCISRKEETLVFSLLFSTFTLFTGIGILLGGVLPKVIGGRTTIYQSSILLAAFLILIIAIVRGFLLPKENISWVKPMNSFNIKNFINRFSSRTLWLFSIYTFFIGMAFSFLNPYYNIIIKFRFNWSDIEVSSLLAVTGIFLFLGSFFLPMLIERMELKKLYFFVYLVNIALSVLLFFTIPVTLFIFLFLIRGGSFTMLSNLIDSQSMQAIKEEERNLFAGMRSVSRSVGSAIASYIAAFILASKNFSLPFLLTGIVLIISYLFFLKYIYPELKEKDI
ncbi:MAG: MFS transporter [Vulcanibacillus sp.]